MGLEKQNGRGIKYQVARDTKAAAKTPDKVAHRYALLVLLARQRPRRLF